MDKFGRNYSLEVQANDGTFLTIEPPFTVEFDITMNTLTSANICQIRIYNLSLKSRNLIRHNVTDFGLPYQSVALRAGYGTNLPLIFTGNISQAWSVREGTNFITQIECYDGGFAYLNANADATFPAGTPNQAVIAGLIATLPNVQVGSVGSYPGVLGRGASFSGNTISILNDLTGGGFFIANGKANALGTNEFILSVGGVTEISPDSGLLGTPILEQKGIVRFDMLFEPQLYVGRSILLTSLTENNFSGIYKVTAVKHRGMISESVCGSVITTGEFFYYNPLLGVASP